MTALTDRLDKIHADCLAIDAREPTAEEIAHAKERAYDPSMVGAKQARHWACRREMKKIHKRFYYRAEGYCGDRAAQTETPPDSKGHSVGWPSREWQIWIFMFHFYLDSHLGNI